MINKILNKQQLLAIIVSALLLIIALIIPESLFALRLIIFLAAFLSSGAEVIIESAKGIMHGDIFNENFLMSIASIGAFCIGEFPEAVCVMILYQTGELFQDYAVDKSRKSISDLMDICPDTACVIRNEKSLIISPEEVKIGEIIMIKPGEKIPLDAVITEGETTLDTSSLTGEAMPLHVGTGDTILSGAVNLTSRIYAKVTKSFTESTASKILELVENAESKKSKSENFITKFAKYYTPTVVAAAFILAVFPPLLSDKITFAEQFYKALSFLVVSCPCALVISVPLSFFGGLGTAAHDGILIKGSNYLEALSHAEIAVFDKTGTLTEGSFNVSEIVSEEMPKESLLEIAAYAESLSNHPIAVSVCRAYNKEINTDLILNYAELPGYGICADIHGKKVFVGNAKLMQKAGISDISEKTSDSSVLHIALNGKYVGYIVIADKIKSDAKAAVSELKANGIAKTVMLTGDSEKAGRSIAKNIDIDEAICELLPADKVSCIEKLITEKTPSGKLIYAGDGINDAPSLARADVGIAMGALGSDAAIEAADVVIMTDEISKINSALNIAKRTVTIAKQNIAFALFVKFLILILCTFGAATMWAAVFSDVGVSVLAIINSMRNLKRI